jgi:hypothetical protein
MPSDLDQRISLPFSLTAVNQSLTFFRLVLKEKKHETQINTKELGGQRLPFFFRQTFIHRNSSLSLDFMQS